MHLRPYQQAAHDAAADWIRRCMDPCLIEAPTGAGKSWVIAALAQTVLRWSGKRVLCLAPKAELVYQNRDKYLTTGEPASMYSASSGSKCLKHPVIFATPGTAKRGLDRIAHDIGCIVIDEAHSITPTVRSIVKMIRKRNPRVRVVGLTATPYRLGEGYIYEHDHDGAVVEQAREPYFRRLVYRIDAQELIHLGWLTPPNIGEVGDHYNALQLEIDNRGRFNSQEVEQVFEGKGRKTSKIIANIVSLSRGRMGVMIFAATVDHAHECMESLPPGISEIITGNTSMAERKRILKQFDDGQVKYLVNVSVLTTGFDAEHIDVIAILRATESSGLLLQIIGRGLRIHPGKPDCLVLDYAENIKRHAPDGDIFNPDIEIDKRKKCDQWIKAQCPLCSNTNEYPARENPDGFKIDEEGYFLDLEEERIPTEHGDMPAHYGRRCVSQIIVAGRADRCSYRWTVKECPECGHENDIAARRCEKCRCEIVDPNENLHLEFERAKSDPLTPSTDEVRQWFVQPTISRAGNPVTKVTFITDYNEVTIWIVRESNAIRAQQQAIAFDYATNNGNAMPKTITYCKDTSNPKFWRVIGYNRNPDEIPE